MIELIYLLPGVPILASAGAYAIAAIRGLTDDLEQLPAVEKPLPLIPRSIAEVKSLEAFTPAGALEQRKETSLVLQKETSELLSKASRRIEEALDHFVAVNPNGDEVRELKLLEARLMENVDALRKSVHFGSSRAPEGEEALFLENLRIISAAAYRISGSSVTAGKKSLRTLNKYLVRKEGQAIAAGATAAREVLDGKFSSTGRKNPWWQRKLKEISP